MRSRPILVPADGGLSLLLCPPELADGLGFDLSHAFACDLEDAAHVLQPPDDPFIIDAVAHHDDLPFPEGANSNLKCNT